MLLRFAGMPPPARHPNRLSGIAKRGILIALSGFGRPEDKEKSKSAGFDEHLTKPTDFDRLIELINNYDGR